MSLWLCDNLCCADIDAFLRMVGVPLNGALGTLRRAGVPSLLCKIVWGVLGWRWGGWVGRWTPINSSSILKGPPMGSCQWLSLNLKLAWILFLPTNGFPFRPPFATPYPSASMWGSPIAPPAPLSLTVPLPECFGPPKIDSDQLAGALHLLHLREGRLISPLPSPPSSPTPAPPSSPSPSTPPSRAISRSSISPPRPSKRSRQFVRPYVRKDQRCTLRDPSKVLCFQVSNFWQKLQQDHDVFAVQRAFREVLGSLQVEEHHDVLGCRECKFSDLGRVTYCTKSRHNKSHPYHSCPAYEICCT